MINQTCLTVFVPLYLVFFAHSGLLHVVEGAWAALPVMRRHKCWFDRQGRVNVANFAKRTIGNMEMIVHVENDMFTHAACFVVGLLLWKFQIVIITRITPVNEKGILEVELLCIPWLSLEQQFATCGIKLVNIIFLKENRSCFATVYTTILSVETRPIKCLQTSSFLFRLNAYVLSHKSRTYCTE